MRLRRRLIVAAVLAFVAGVVATFPARVAYRWFAPPDVALSGIDGTLWNGSARQASIVGVYLQNMRWVVKPSYLFRARLGFAVEAQPASGFIEADVGLGFGGSVAMKDVSASLPLGAFASALRMNGLGGTASLRFDRFELADGLPVAADGELTVANLVAPRIYRGSIGGYRVEFFTSNDGVAASIEDTDGLLDLAGSLQIGSDRAYQFIAQVAPKPGTPASVARQLRVLGSPDERGQRELRLEGEL